MLLLPRYHGFWEALRYGSFQVASVMSTTGYATADFNLWPVAVKMVLLLVMIVGGVARLHRGRHQGGAHSIAV